MSLIGQNIFLGNSLYSSANPGASPPFDNTSLFNLSKYSYFEGPNGNNTISYNAWGRAGNTAGADRIWGPYLTAANGNYGMGDYIDSQYFCDNANFRVDLLVNNSTPVVPPPSPGEYDIQDLTLNLWDSTKTYNYLSVNTGFIGWSTTYGNNTISTTSTPNFAFSYWELLITTAPNYLGTNVTVDIGGNVVLTSQPVVAGNTSYDWQSFSAGTNPGNGFYFGINFS